MAGTAAARSKTNVPIKDEDQETYFGFFRLYLLSRAGEEPISIRAISEELAHRG
jgi:hypothetical protein